MQRATAALVSRKSPPSLKESGVMLTTPMTSVRRPSSRVRVRSFHAARSLIGGSFPSLVTGRMARGKLNGKVHDWAGTFSSQMVRRELVPSC